MFKNAFIYRLASDLPELSEVETSLHSAIFTPCGPTQEKSIGWVPPRGHEHGALVESVGGQWILSLKTEIKKVPAKMVKDEADRHLKGMELLTGRKSGKKQRKEKEEDVLLSFLPHAFPSSHITKVWINPESGLAVIDAGSQSKADEAVTELIRSIDGLTLQLVTTNMTPASSMALWLVEMEPPEGFTVDRECELRAMDESKAVVKYGRHPLDIEEVADHIKQGKMPTKLALTYKDRVSFVLTDAFVLKKITILDVVFESQNESEDHFDADVAIMTGELAPMLEDLIFGLSGEFEAA